jgi:hypothetical protein
VALTFAGNAITYGGPGTGRPTIDNGPPPPAPPPPPPPPKSRSLPAGPLLQRDGGLNAAIRLNPGGGDAVVAAPPVRAKLDTWFPTVSIPPEALGATSSPTSAPPPPPPPGATLPPPAPPPASLDVPGLPPPAVTAGPGRATVFGIPAPLVAAGVGLVLVGYLLTRKGS